MDKVQDESAKKKNADWMDKVQDKSMLAKSSNIISIWVTSEKLFAYYLSS